MASFPVNFHSAGEMELTMQMSKQAYKQLAEKKTKPSIIARDLVLAFVVGGLICCLGQLISTGAKTLLKLDKDGAAIATAVTLVFLGILFTGLKLYGKLAKYAGGGTLVPITGFANAIVSPALEFKTEGLVLGLAVKMFTIAGPVIVYGTIASVLYGLILVLFKGVGG
jgi:stage V sporulation protein AC